jgi:hypothetical protein
MADFESVATGAMTPKVKWLLCAGNSHSHAIEQHELGEAIRRQRIMQKKYWLFTFECLLLLFVV